MAEHQLPTAPTEEIPTNEWQKEGFLRELGTVCENLEACEEMHIFSPELRQIIDTVLNLKTVEDFAQYSDDRLLDYINTIRRDVPRVEHEIMQFITQISRARTVAFEVDFI